MRRKSLDLLARREHSRWELERKLAARGFERAVVDTVLDKLAEQSLQSDERFVQALVYSRIQRGQGPLRIRADLAQRGVADELAGAYLERDDQIWAERAAEVHRRRFGEGSPREPKLIAKQMRFLAGRGFTQPQIRAALRATNV